MKRNRTRSPFDAPPQRQLPPPIAEPEPGEILSGDTGERPDDSGERFRIQFLRNWWPTGLLLSGIMTSFLEVAFWLGPSSGITPWDFLFTAPAIGTGAGMTMAAFSILLNYPTPVRVSSQGIRLGPADHEFIWWDQLIEARKTRSLGVLPYIHIRSAVGKEFDIPVYLRRPDRFAAAIEQLAPKDNPLRQLILADAESSAARA